MTWFRSQLEGEGNVRFTITDAPGDGWRANIWQGTDCDTAMSFLHLDAANGDHSIHLGSQEVAWLEVITDGPFEANLFIGPAQ